MRGGHTTSGRSVSLRRAWRYLRGARNPQNDFGFTVIEVVVVLAISGLLFVSAAVLISGRQNQTAFDQSTQQIQSQIQQTLNEVSTGYFPGNSDFKCESVGSGQPPLLSSVSTGQGSNSGCIFLGKAMQFNVDNSDPQIFSVYTIAGLQKSSTGDEASSLAEAMPMVIAPSSPTHNNAGYPDNSVNDFLQNGLKAVRMWYNNGGSDIDIGAIAFVNSLASFGGSGQIVSGAGSVNIIALTGTSLGLSKLDMAELMNSDGGNKITNGVINPAGGVFVCFDGGTEDYAIVRIGGESRELTVTLTTKDKGGGSCTYP